MSSCDDLWSKRSFKFGKSELNIVIPSSLALEFLALIFSGYSYSSFKKANHQEYDDDPMNRTEQMFMIVVLFGMALNFFWLRHYRKRQLVYTMTRRAVRIFEGFCVLAAASFYFYNIFRALDSCRDAEAQNESVNCQRFGPKLVAATLAVLDTILHFMSPIMNTTTMMTIKPRPMTDISRSGDIMGLGYVSSDSSEKQCPTNIYTLTSIYPPPQTTEGQLGIGENQENSSSTLQKSCLGQESEGSPSRMVTMTTTADRF